jgi:hypothetical protein
MISLALLMALAYCPRALSAEVVIGADGTPCVDNHDNCPFWASTGECDNNRSYMGANCRLSCDRCQ